MKPSQGSQRFAVTSLAVLVILLLSVSWALADTSPSSGEWSRTFGGIEEDVGYSVQVTSDGGYIITGAQGSGVFLVKIGSQVIEEQTRTATIIGINAPSEVYVGELFTVEVTVSYEFSESTEMLLSFYDNARAYVFLYS